MTGMRRAWLKAAAGALVLASLSACVSTGRLTPGEAGTPQFDAAVFFAGRTQGQGRLKVATQRSEVVTVVGHGLVNAGGAIVLDQSVQRGDRPATTRQWLLRQDGPGRYVGTLSDASGPVVGEVSGNVLHLRFGMKGGFRADQWLTLQPGGAEVRNVMIIRKFGLAVARLDETILREAN